MNLFCNKNNDTYRIESLEVSVERLENRLYLIENPFKYDISQVVPFLYNNKWYDSIITEREIKRTNYYHGISEYKKYYNLFCSELKLTSLYEESEIIMK